MASLRRWIWRLFPVFFALLLALAALWAYGRFTSPTAAQRAAVALMQALPAVEGENGFALLRAQPPAPTPALPEALRCAEAEAAACLERMAALAPADLLPPACAAPAEAPDPAQEGLLCPALRGEWRYTQRLMPALEREGAGQVEGVWRFLPHGLLHDGEWAQAVRAETFAIACSEAAVAAARADRPIGLAPGKVRWVDHIAYPASAALLSLGEPFWRPYQERQLDFLALRLETSPDGNAVLVVPLRAPRSTAVEAEARFPVAGPLAAP